MLGMVTAAAGTTLLESVKSATKILMTHRVGTEEARIRQRGALARACSLRVGEFEARRHIAHGTDVHGGPWDVRTLSAAERADPQPTLENMLDARSRGILAVRLSGPFIEAVPERTEIRYRQSQTSDIGEFALIIIQRFAEATGAAILLLAVGDAAQQEQHHQHTFHVLPHGCYEGKRSVPHTTACLIR
jgi:hypothetical protein